MKNRIFKTILMASLLLMGCDDSTDRFEVINKLRGIGVQMEPFAPIASTTDAVQTVSLTFYIAAPKGTEAPTLANYDDPGAPTSRVTPGLEPTLSNTQDLGELQVFEITAQATVPTAETLLFNAQGIASLRYGIRATSGSDDEIIVGNILIHAENSEVLTWSPHSLSMADITAANSADLKGTIENDNEKYKVSWWTTGGKIKNAAALETMIEELPAGDHTILLTARGMTSGGFVWTNSQITVPES